MIDLQKRIQKILKDDRVKYKNFNQLFSFLSKYLKEDPENIAKSVNKMISDGLLIENGRRQLVPSGALGLKKGILVGNQRGFAFVKPVTTFGKTSKNQTDLFIPPNKLAGALDGDVVLYKEEANSSAFVVKILKRGNNFFIGKVVSVENYKTSGKNIGNEGFFVKPNNAKFSKLVFISKKETKGAKVDDSVEVELTFQPEGARGGFPLGRVKRILEKDDDIENGIASILCDSQIPYEFPQKLLEEAEKLSTNYEEIKKQRVDLTKNLIVTIDGADAKDFDDAISIEKTSTGYVLGVHIADVGEYVKQGNEMDKEAFIRGTSVYFPDRVYPMLPEKISNFLCSLRPNEEKLALSVEMILDNDGVVKSYKIFESVIKSSARLTYDQAYDVIKKATGDQSESRLSEEFPEIKDKNIRDVILLMNELSQKIGKIRKKEGMLDFEIAETYFDVKGKTVLDVRKRERNDAHKLIENFMILCNQVVAQHFFLSKIPFVYRVHEAPSKARINEVVETLNALGLNVKFINKIDPKFIQEMLNKLKGNLFEEVGNKILLRSMEKAIYLEECLGHFGLALQYYCHFTSPIRRYPDLTIHRIIKKACHVSPNNIVTRDQINDNEIKKIFKKDYDLEEFVADSSFQSSERELKADEAERAADDLFKAKFMQDKVGQEFEGRVNGVNSFGIFVELPNTVEGMIKVENLPADDYKFDEARFVLKGKNHKYNIGDKINVILANVNLTTRKIEFLLK